MSTIELIAIAKHYGSIKAADAVDLHVEEGEFVTILGPSGSGKTTLLILIAGLAPPTSGQILLGGRDVTWLASAQRNVGLVFQSYALFPHMSVFDNIAFALSVRGRPKQEIRTRVEEALELVRLGGFGQRRPHQLSGGQQQRVALARAFVFEPEILLLDEPMAALDRKLRQEVQVELRELQRSLGITTILVTHDQEEALSLSDRIVVLDQGRVQQVAAPEEAYLRPSNRFVADFLGTANFFEGELRRDGEAWEMLMDDGETVACVAPEVAPAGRACAVLRPERIRLGLDAVERGLAAKVRGAIYLGQFIRYHLQLANGNEVIAVSPDRVIKYGPGSEVTLSWEPGDVWIIPDTNSGADA